MGRHSTNRIIIDQTLKIRMKDLKRFGYLKTLKEKKGVFKWSSNYGFQSEASILVNNNVLTLNYKSNGTAICYNVQIIYINSNLGKGQIPLFLCPKTKKRCRTLYLVNSYFLHRTASQNIIYDSQTKSNNYRVLNNSFGSILKLEDYYNEINSKHFRTHYKGKLTKRYKKLLNKINSANQITF